LTEVFGKVIDHFKNLADLIYDLKAEASE